MSSKPYGDAAPAYQRAGWSPVPLPAGFKSKPLIGWTGYDAPWASGADVHDWIDAGWTNTGPEGTGAVPAAQGNIGLRMPETVLGLDLDNYGDKPGLATMLAACERLGPLPPTVCSTSRDDGASGIRFYRVPPGRRWADVLAPGVEVVHWGHRYAVAAPSIHPEGRTYRWTGPDLQPMDGVPAVADLPELPASWVAELDRGDAADRSHKADLAAGDVGRYLSQLPAGQACQYVVRLLDDASAALASAASRHDTARGYVIRMVRAGEQGHEGAAAGLNTLEAIWLDSLRRGNARPADAGEWERMVTGAVAITTAKPTEESKRGCCGIVPPLTLVPNTAVTAPPNRVDQLWKAPAGEQVDLASEQVDLASEQAAAFAREVERETYRIRVRDAARDSVAADRAAEIPLPGVLQLRDLLAVPDAEIGYRVDRVWPSGGRCVLSAQHKAGKTTLAENLLRSLVDGEPFLGSFDVNQASRVLLIDNELVSGCCGGGCATTASLMSRLSTWSRFGGAPRASTSPTPLRAADGPATSEPPTCSCLTACGRPSTPSV